MQNQHNTSGELSLSEALRLAKSPAGQKLLQLLRQTGGNELQEAVSKASGGDYAQAKQAISSLLDNPEVRKLLEQMGR